MNLRDSFCPIAWLRKVHRWYFSGPRKWFLAKIWMPVSRRTLYRALAAVMLSRVRRAYGKRPLRVAFLLSNPSKWKVQSLYDLMAASDKFDPIVVITPMDVEYWASANEKRLAIEKVELFAKGHGIRYELGYDCKTGEYFPLNRFEADIVWYTQPWFISARQGPRRVAFKSLTCYTPYFVQNYGGLDMDCALDIHRVVWRHFTLNDAWAKEFNRYQGNDRAGCVVGVGHPMLDAFHMNDGVPVEKKYVIYAPHWSCNTCECFSTFLENGREMLSLAQRHPEIQWVFKPHPTLRTTLLESAGWNRQEVDLYYAAWERIAIACYDSSYVTLFKNSIAMITDCASFLVEYACTGNPIIHLISSNAKYQPHPISKKLFGAYYEAHNWNEFVDHFNEVVLNRNDYKRGERLAAVKDMRLLDNYAGKNIVDYLELVFAGKKK